VAGGPVAWLVAANQILKKNSTQFSLKILFTNSVKGDFGFLTLFPYFERSYN
jgi:hypothetical protein